MTRPVLIAFFCCLAVSGCATTGGLRSQPLESGVSRVFAAPQEPIIAAARQAMVDAGLKIDDAYAADAGTFVLQGSKGASGFSWGELVRVVVAPAAADATRVSVVTQRRLATNVTAQGDYSGAIFGGIEVFLATNRPVAVLPSPEANSGQTSTGTCFAVRDDGTLMTANHIIEGAADIRVLWRGTWYTAEVVGTSAALDGAVLSIPTRTETYIPLSGDPALRPGSRVFTVGFPVVDLLGTDPKFAEGTVSALSGIRGDRSYMQVSIPIQPGNSGGPVVTEDGIAVGVIVSTAAVERFYNATGSLPQSVNWAVKAESLQAIASFQPGEPTSSRDLALERATNAICLVEATAR